jgi:hypothetical protein
MNRASEIGPSTVPWWRDWRGECVAIIAGGPSAKTAGVEKLRNRINVICINDAYRLAPWGDVLYSCDPLWWQHHKGVPTFQGLKLTWDATVASQYKLHKITIEKPESNELLVERPSYIGAGGASGFQGFNIAVQFGGTGIALIGCDCTVEYGEHWFGRHPVPLNNPLRSQANRWKLAFEGAAPRCKVLGIDVVNCSPISTLTCYPKVTIDQMLERWGL